ncbi:hypothetical protein [Nocardioides sp.]|uniref:hypothetical protein n=1 Tax=Nocardioides sp. TaxID=35761 RepID=UPI003569D9DA
MDRHFLCRRLSNARDELSVLRDLLDQARRLSSLQARPLVVVTADETLETHGWSGAQDKLAALSTNRLHTVAHSTHAGLLTDVLGSRASTEAIEAAVRAVRGQTSLTGS